MSATAWRLLRHPPGSASWNMSVDEALLCGVLDAVPTLRLYAWERPSVSIGYRQAIPPWVDRCDAFGVDRVRRASGGGTVVHAGDLTYSVAAPLEEDHLPAGLDGSYGWIQRVLVEGLRRAGLDARPSRAQERAPWMEVCFAGSTGYEVEIAGAKRVGSAQRRTSWGLLQHGSIRLEDDSALYRDLLGEDPPHFARDGLVTRDAASDAIVSAFSDALAGRLEPGELSVSELANVSQRVAERQRDPLVAPSLTLTRFRGVADRQP